MMKVKPAEEQVTNSRCFESAVIEQWRNQLSNPSGAGECELIR